MTQVVWLMFAGTMASSRNPPPPPSPPAAAVTVPAGAVTATLELSTTIEQLNALTEFQRTTFESDIVNYITRQLLALRPPGQVVITGIRAGSIVVRIPAWQRLPNGASRIVLSRWSSTSLAWQRTRCRAGLPTGQTNSSTHRRGESHRSANHVAALWLSNMFLFCRGLCAWSGCVVGASTDAAAGAAPSPPPGRPPAVRLLSPSSRHFWT